MLDNLQNVRLKLLKAVIKFKYAIIRGFIFDV